MEHFSGLSIRKIFLHNQNWWKFFTTHEHLIRESIVENVCKVLACKTDAMGFHIFKCYDCKHEKKSHILVSHAFAHLVVRKQLNNGSQLI